MLNIDGSKKFDRLQMYSRSVFNFIGSGERGGKASGLLRIKETLDSNFEDNKFNEIEVNIPNMTVILTDIFDIFMRENNLYEISLSNASDKEIANAFQKSDLPVLILGDLVSLISKINKPLAIRSSSLLEDDKFEPFAGVYQTKMIPNNQCDRDSRFNKLVEAIKFVYSSVFFKNSKEYFEAIKKDIKLEKMAIIIQEIIGERYDDCFYPTISGVARSYNYYPTGNSKPEDGIVNLALGLGKAIVDGGKCWSYSPKFPSSPPPYNSIKDMLKMTQTEFWSVNMKNLSEYNPLEETEYMLSSSISKAEYDGTINNICSTYDFHSDIIYSGVSNNGPRIINFAPILKSKLIPLNDLIIKLLKISEEKFDSPVEIEFAMIFDKVNKKTKRFGFLQVRPMLLSNKQINFDINDYIKENILLYSENIMGNGIVEDIEDIVFIKPDEFKVESTRNIATEIGEINESLLKERKKYLLIGFGRWGTSDPWLGIPVVFSQISGAKVIVESTISNMNSDYSQGSHFFHNMTSLDVFYFACKKNKKFKIDWNWLLKQQCINETKFVKHIKLKSPLKVITDGKSRTGVILK